MTPSVDPAGAGAFAIESLITERCRELGLSRAELVRRAGYRNISKGLRRLDELCAGEFRLTKDLIRGLPGALEVPAHVVESAIEELRETERRRAAEREAAWRAAFKPHAIALTERTVPSPIFVAALSNATKYMRTELDPTVDPATFFDQALRGLRATLGGRDWSGFPGFGRVTGIAVNYTPDHAVCFDLEGKPFKVLRHACRLGEAQLLARGRPIPPGLLSGTATERRIGDLQ